MTKPISPTKTVPAIMLNPSLCDGPSEVALMSDLERAILKNIYKSGNEGLRLWQVQKKVGGTKHEVGETLHALLAAGYIGILSMGGGPKYHKISSKGYILTALDERDAEGR